MDYQLFPQGQGGLYEETVETGADCGKLESLLTAVQ